MCKGGSRPSCGMQEPSRGVSGSISVPRQEANERISSFPFRNNVGVTPGTKIFGVSPVVIEDSHPQDEMRRKHLRQVLETRLREKHGALDSDRLRKASRYIEHLLYLEEQKASCEDYADCSKLEERLAPLLKRLLQRKAQKLCPLRPTEKRRLIAQSMKSSQDFAVAQRLVQDIKRLRLEYVSTGCTSWACRRECKNNMLVVPACEAGALPDPVANLFFRKIRLMEVFEGSEKVFTEDIQLPWKVLIEEASAILEEYREWALLTR